MSVINQMLQDLETRHGALGTQNVDHVPLRPAGVIDKRHVSKSATLVGTVAAALLAVAAWWMVRDKRASVPPAEPPIAAMQRPANAPAIKPGPLTALQTPPHVTAPLVPVIPTVPPPAAIVAEADAKHRAAVRPLEPSKPPRAELAALPDATEAPVAALAADTPVPPAASSALSKAPRANAPIPGMEAQVPDFKQRNPQQRIDERYRDALRKLNDGRFAAARGDLAEVLQIEPKHSGARLALVGIELEEKRAAQAEKLLRDGIQLQPNENSFSMALARLEVERGDVDAALATLGQARTSAGDEADYHGFYAALLQRAGRHAEAIEHYQLALRQREAANWFVGMGISLEAAKRTGDAEQIYRRAQQSAGLTPELHDFASQRLQQLRR